MSHHFVMKLVHLFLDSTWVNFICGLSCLWHIYISYYLLKRQRSWTLVMILFQWQCDWSCEYTEHTTDYIAKLGPVLFVMYTMCNFTWILQYLQSKKDTNAGKLSHLIAEKVIDVLFPFEISASDPTKNIKRSIRDLASLICLKTYVLLTEFSAPGSIRSGCGRTVNWHIQPLHEVWLNNDRQTLVIKLVFEMTCVAAGRKCAKSRGLHYK